MSTVVNKGGEVGRYRDHGAREHRVRVRHVPGAWEILDCETTRVTVVDRLEGPDESRATASAVAADWIAQRQ
jgi:hypothetical protein